MQHFTRYEFKYQITPTIAAAIRARLLRFGMKPDPASSAYPNNTYPVTSLYFDTPAMDDYHDKAGGFLHRKKIRVRIYTPYLIEGDAKIAFSLSASEPNPILRAPQLRGEAIIDKVGLSRKEKAISRLQPEIWLEKKEKYEMLVSKKRVPLTIKEYDDLLYESRLDLVKTYPLFLPLITHGMRPTAMVRYLREPFGSSHQSHLRITFDSHIEACHTHDLRFPTSMTPVAKHAVIMEVKFSWALPYWFRLLLADFDLYRQSFSKYGESMEVLHHFHQIPR